MTIELLSDPSDADIAAVQDGLAAFNASDVGPSGRMPLVAVLREGGAVRAGLVGYTAWGWLYVEKLWVAEALRGRGVARALLAAAEAEAMTRGCHASWLDTFNPDALRLYRRLGYEPFGALPEFVAGRTRHFLRKIL